MANPMEKIIELISQTGDRCIVLNPQGEPAYVVLTLADYQSLIEGRRGLIGLTEAELLGQINRDIAAWKASQDEAKLDNWESLGSVLDKVKIPKIRRETVDSELAAVVENEKIWPISAKNEPGEDQYYFEPIE